MTTSHFNYSTSKIRHTGCSVDAQLNVLSIQHLPPSIIALIVIWHYWSCYYLIETQPFGKAKPSDLLALVALIPLKSAPPAKWFTLSIIPQCINQYLWATAEYCPVQCAKIKLSVKLCNQPGADSMTPAVLRFLDPLTASDCHCADIHQHQFRLVPWWSCGRMNLGHSV